MHVMNEANGPEGGTDWQRVNWRKAERTVRNLRQRLFRAAQQGDLRGVHALQKLLLRSYSNTLVSVRRVTRAACGKAHAGRGQGGHQDASSPWTPRGPLVHDTALACTPGTPRVHPQSNRQTPSARNSNGP